MNGWWWLDELDTTVLVLLAVSAWRWGAAPERWAAATMAGMDLADRIYHFVAGRGAFYNTVDLGHFAIDSAAAAFFLLLAARANRVYPLCLAALQLVSVLMHLARAADPAGTGFAYAWLAYGPWYLEVVTLAVGMTRHALRVRRIGSYRSFRG